jgi:hypothetical protein
MFFSRALSDKAIRTIVSQQDPAGLRENYLRVQESGRMFNGMGKRDMVENRMISDGGREWLTEKGARTIIDTIKSAGFNVYQPLIWHGRGTRFPSAHAPFEADLPRHDGDPLARLIKIAHENGVEVHPWVMISKRWKEYPDFLRQYYDPGTPEGAYDMHKPAFREFVATLVADVVRRYNVDGINLDYVRTQGICISAYCVADYRRRFGRSLASDAGVRRDDGSLEPHVQQWQDEDVAAFVGDVSRRIRELKPRVVISVSGVPVPGGLPGNDQGRQELAWLRDGWVDIVYNMQYSIIPDFEKHELVQREIGMPGKIIITLANWEKDSTGMIVPRDPKVFSRLVAYALSRWPGNVAVYRYKELSENKTQGKLLSEGPFRNHATPRFDSGASDGRPR